MTIPLPGNDRVAWDVLVIGGGATGAGVAWDAARRGLSVMLVDRADFGSGTSCTSTKLAHGGVRYLEKAVRSLDLGQLRLVTSALRERARMIAAAPHLAHRAALLIPLRSHWQRFYYGVGLALYERLAGKRSLGKTRRVNAAELREIAPGLQSDAYVGGVVFFDGSFDDARFALELVLSAEAAGARVRNYTEVTELVIEAGVVKGAHLRDAFTGERSVVHAQHTIQCTGSHADAFRLAVRSATPPRLRPSQGIHVVLDRTWWPGDVGLLIPKTPDGRVLFCMPFESKVLVGTTDTEVRDPNSLPHATEDDIAFVLETFSAAIGREVPRDAVRATWAGYRPLVAAKKGARTEALIRDHEVEVWAEEHFLNVLGGKWTTYRAMAEDAVDRLCELRGEKRACDTAEQSLLRAMDPKAILSQPELRALPNDIAAHLVRYGSRAIDIARDIAREADARILPEHPYTWPELRFAVRHEHVRRLDDVLDRRWRIGQVDSVARKTLAERIQPAFDALTSSHPLVEPFSR